MTRHRVGWAGWGQVYFNSCQDQVHIYVWPESIYIPSSRLLAVKQKWFWKLVPADFICVRDNSLLHLKESFDHSSNLIRPEAMISIWIFFSDQHRLLLLCNWKGPLQNYGKKETVRIVCVVALRKFYLWNGNTIFLSYTGSCRVLFEQRDVC